MYIVYILIGISHVTIQIQFLTPVFTFQPLTIRELE